MNDIKMKLDAKMKFMIFSVIAFILTLVSATYAWVASDLVTPSTSLYVGSVSLSVVYTGAADIVVADIAPGESVTKEFQVENTGSASQIYNLKWINVTNNLIDKNYFMYTIKDQDTNEELFYPRYLPSNSTHIEYGITIAAGETHNYEMTIYYVDDPKYNQLQNADLYFSGNLSIEQGSNEQRIQDRLSIYVNGTHSDFLPTLSQYSIDTTRTFCTEGSSISIVNGDLEISNLSDITSCELYLVSSSPAAITNDPYNLLIIDTNGGTLSSTPGIKYRYSGDIVSLGIPEKSGYAFLGWQASGAGTQVIDNTKVVMGTTYSYVKALWSAGHWNKIVQTCGSNGVETYNRTYKTCNENIANYTKTEKTCAESSWNKTTSVCGVSTVTKNTYNCAASAWSYPSSPSSTTTAVLIDNCTATTPACSSASNVGNTKVTCTKTEWRKKGKNCTGSYAWTNETYTLVTSACTKSSNIPTTCDASNADKTYITRNCVQNFDHYTCRAAATSGGTCTCINTDNQGSMYDAGCQSNQAKCSSVCAQLGGSMYSFQPNVSCRCPSSSATLSGNYCYLYNQSSCSGSYSVYTTYYRKYTKGCLATYTLSDFNNLTNTNCESYHGATAPTSCGASNLGEHITYCVATKVTKRTYVCAASGWSYPSSANTTSTVAPTSCTAASPSCSSSSDVGNTKTTCGDPKTYGWTSSSTTTSETCEASGTCSSSTSGNSYVTACSAVAYNFGNPTPSTVSSCTPNPVICSSSTNGQTDVACTPNYTYSLSSSTQSDVVDACETSDFTCDSSTSGDLYVTACSPATYGYGYSPSTVTSASCFVDSSHNTCGESNVGDSYIYACELVED